MDKEIILLKVSSALLTLTERQNSRSGYRPGWDNNCPLSVGQDRDLQKKRRRGHSSTPSYSKNCVAVIHFGCSMWRLKSLYLRSGSHLRRKR